MTATRRSAPDYAPYGRMLVDGDHVCCHLCGHWFLSVASHLRRHGWTKHEYIAAFGLEVGSTLAGEATHKRRAAALTARSVTEPVIQQAQEAARHRARSGELTVAAAAAARGRVHPAQRRPKTMAALGAISARARAEGTARWAKEHRDAVAASVARAFGFADFEAYVVDRLAAGLSMAAISREAGLHKDWLSRHLDAVAPLAASERRDLEQHGRDQRWLPIVTRLGLGDVASFLRARHIDEHRTVAAIASEVGFSRESVENALRRHGITASAHASKRHEREERDRRVAERVGFESLGAYVADRRSAGATWSAMAAETGLPEATLRRRGHV